MANVPQSEGRVGPVVDGNPAKAPEHVRISGRHIVLEPLSSRHAADLFALSNGPEREDLWRYLAHGPFDSAEQFDAFIAGCATSRDPLFFALIEPSGRAIGFASLMRIDAPNRVIEIGYILYTPAIQRTIAATEVQYLFARHVFETLGMRRYEWKCNDFNEPSKRAALRLGFAYEGLFRQHMIVKGHSRDTAWFAMLDHEWPARKAAFEAWLAPDNFDAQGNQRTALNQSKT